MDAIRSKADITLSRDAPLIDVTDVCRKPTHVSTGACRCGVYKAGTGRHWTGSTRSAEIVQWSRV